MEDRLAELEIKFMAQEETIEILSQELYRQQQSVTRLENELLKLNDRIKSLAASPVASESEEVPPPHY